MAREGQQQPIDLSDGLSVHFRPPFELDDSWKEWLGTIAVENVRESTFAIIATAPSANPSVLDDEHELLNRMVHSLWYAILLHGVPHHEGMLNFQGSNVDGQLTVRSQSTPPPQYRPRFARPVLITPSLLASADTVAVGIRRIYAQTSLYARFKRGLMGAWLSGMCKRYGDARLHQFIRATEALIKPRVGETKRMFVHRGQLFLGVSDQSRDLLGTVFDLRSAAEHMNDFETVLNVPPQDRERIAWLRSYQAEMLAGSNYVRVLSNPELLEIFRDDASIDAFWQVGDAERRGRWGAPLKLDRLATERHTGELEPEPAPISVDALTGR
jgi:hypothetical protein